MAWEAPIAGSGEGYIQTAGTSCGEGQLVRSAERERAAREFAAMQPKPVTQKHPWVLEAEAEQAQKDAIRAEKIRTGKLIIHPDGGYTEKL